MGEFAVHHNVALLMKKLNLQNGPGPEVYADVLIKDLQNYTASPINIQKELKNISEGTLNSEELIKTYESLKNKNIKELDSYIVFLNLVKKDPSVQSLLSSKNIRYSNVDEVSVNSFNSNQSSSSSLQSSLIKAASRSSLEEKTSLQLKKNYVGIKSSDAIPASDTLIKSIRDKQYASLEPTLPSDCQLINERVYMTRDFSETTSHVNDDVASLENMPLPLQELIIVEDLLFILMAIEGRYIFVNEKESQKFFSIDNSLDKSLQSLVSDVLPMANFYSTIQNFIEKNSSFSKSLIMQSLAASFRFLIKDYLIFICQLENSHRIGALSVQRLYYNIQGCKHQMDILASFCNQIDKCNGLSSSILSMLHEKVQLFIGDPISKDLSLFLIQSACTPYFDILSQWIYSGIIIDPYEEFMVNETNESESTSSQNNSDSYWAHHYKLVKERIPSFLANYSDKILNAGKYLNVYFKCVTEGGNLKKSAVDHNLTYSVTDKNYILAIEEAYKFANGQLLALLMDKYQLTQRLRSLKYHFLLEKGDNFQHFFDLAENELNKLATEIQITRLQSLLEIAVRSSTANSDPFKDDLKADLLPTDLNTELNKILCLAAFKKDFSLLEGFDAFSLDYEVKFPLSLIINKRCLAMYSMLFRHFFQCKHVNRLLSRAWMILTKENKKLILERKKDEVLQKTMLLLNKMIDFIQSYQGYMQFEVIDPNWWHMIENLKIVTNVDQVLTLHKDFLDRSLKECMLTNSKIVKINTAILKLCKSFSNYQEMKNCADIGSLQQSRSNVMLKKLEKSRNKFENEYENFKDINKVNENFENLIIELHTKLTSIDSDRSVMNFAIKLDYTNYYKNCQSKNSLGTPSTDCRPSRSNT